MNTNIVQGVDELITKHLNRVTGGKEDYRRLTTLKEIAAAKDSLQLPELLETLWAQIESNWRNGGSLPGGNENWRFEGKLQLDTENNESEETCLEKGLAIALPRSSWANQIPTSSGLISPASDKKRNIDMAYKNAAGELTLIELKAPKLNAESQQTPVLAAFELVQNAMLLCLARAHRTGPSAINMKDPDVWETAQSVALRVVAPERFYPREWPLHRFEAELNEAISGFKKPNSPQMSFAFRVFDLSAILLREIEHTAAYKRSAA
jgi:hypothetical protein